MFRTLLMYKLKAPARIILLLTVIVLCASLLTGLTISIGGDFLLKASFFTAILRIAMPIMSLTILAMFAYMIATPLLQYYSFYKLHFDNEGYFTFSLPVSTHQQVLSGCLSLLIWQLFSIVVFFFTVLLLILPSAIRYGEFELILKSIPNVFNIFKDPLGLITGICSLAYSSVLPVLSITLGALSAKKHKLLAAFGIGVGISFGISIIATILMPARNYFDTEPSFALINIFYAAVAVGGYFLTYHVIEKKTNI